MVEFEKWVDQYANDLYKQACYLLSDEEDAKDLIQEVFIIAYNQYDTFRKESYPKTWLSGILRNKVAEFYRKKYKSGDRISLEHFFNQNQVWKQTGNLESWTDDEDSLSKDESFHQSLINCLEQLPHRWSILIKLTYFDQKKSSEICQETNISATNYWKILQRSRLQLRECLEINWFKSNV